MQTKQSCLTTGLKFEEIVTKNKGQDAKAKKLIWEEQVIKLLGNYYFLEYFKGLFIFSSIKMMHTLKIYFPPPLNL